MVKDRNMMMMKSLGARLHKSGGGRCELGETLLVKDREKVAHPGGYATSSHSGTIRSVEDERGHLKRWCVL